MAVTGTPISGVEGRVQYGGVNMNLDKFTVTPRRADIPTPNYESGGYDEGLTGLLGADIEFEGNYDISAPPYALLGLTPGVLTDGLKLFVSKTLNSFFSFPSFRLLETPLISEVTDKTQRVAFKGKNDGPFLFPTL